MQQSRQLAAIMFTDMVGYTALMQENEQLALQKRDRNKAIFEKALSKYNGKLLQYYGDGTMSIFTSAVHAIRSAIEMQTLSNQEKIDLRIGIHIGDVMTDENGVYGDSVNVASRIESLAVPGSIFISEKLYDDVKNHEGITAKPIGFFELKNVKQPVQVYAISNEGIVVPSREDIKGKIRQTINSIAVLPFASLSSDPENEFFCDGITEELLNVLAKIDGLQVTSRTSSFAFKGKTEDIREIASRLNVQKVLEGSVRKSGTKVRITAQLINATDGYHIWSETYDRSIDDIFAVQDEIAKEIANKFRLNLNESAHTKQLVKAPTENLEAYKCYLQAMQLYDRPDPADRERALELFNNAIALDPQFAYPHAWLAGLYAFFGQIGAMPAQKAKELTQLHASKAIAIDPDNSMSLTALGIIRFYQDWKWNEALSLFDRAIGINPNDAMVYASRAEVLLVLLRFDDAVEDAVTASRLDPLSADVVATTCRILLTVGRNEEAEAYCKKAESISPHHLLVHNMRAYLTGFNGDWSKALQNFEEAQKIAGDYPLLLLAICIANWHLGHWESLRQLLSKVMQLQADQPDTDFDFMIFFINLCLGNKNSADQYFQRCLDKKLIWCIMFYGSQFMNEFNNYEPLLLARKRLGLPIMKEQAI